MAHWFDLPSELRIQILRHLFANTRLKYSPGHPHPNSDAERSITSILTVSKNFMDYQQFLHFVLLESTIIVDSMESMIGLKSSLDIAYRKQIESITTTDEWASDAFDEDNELSIDLIRSVFPNLKLIFTDISEFPQLPTGMIVHPESKFQRLLDAPLDARTRTMDFDFESEFRAMHMFQQEVEVLIAIHLAHIASQEWVWGLSSLMVDARKNKLDVVLELGQFDVRDMGGNTITSIPVSSRLSKFCPWCWMKRLTEIQRATFDTRDACMHLRDWPGWGEYEVRIPQKIPLWFHERYATLK